MGEWEQKLFDKIKNQEKLDYDDLQVIERCLRIHSLWDELLETLKMNADDFQNLVCDLWTNEGEN
jgi:hypothetical protein